MRGKSRSLIHLDFARRTAFCRAARALPARLAPKKLGAAAGAVADAAQSPRRRYHTLGVNTSTTMQPLLDGGPAHRRRIEQRAGSRTTAADSTGHHAGITGADADQGGLAGSARQPCAP